MSTLRKRALLVTAIVGLALVAAACTGDTSPATSTPPASGATGATPTVSISAAPGSYVYENAGLVVTVKLNGSAGKMTVDNGTGRDLGKPDVYVLDARDGHRVDGKVDGSTPVADGATKDFDVTFPSTVTDKDIGLLILVMGADNMGAFVHQ